MLVKDFVEQIVLASVSTNELEKYINEVRNSVKSTMQSRLDTTREHRNRVHSQDHTNDNPHTNDSDHVDDGTYYHERHSNHTNRGSHSQTTHTNSNWHNNHDQHENSPGGHTNHSKPDECKHTDTPCRVWGPGDHVDGNFHTDWPWHTDRLEHTNTPGRSSGGHTNRTPHNNYYYHRNTGSHTNSRPHINTHDDSIEHRNTGFDHDNYIPSRPHFRVLNDGGKLGGVSNNLMIRDITTIAFYSHDENIDGYGTQDSLSKNVKYILN